MNHLWKLTIEVGTMKLDFATGKRHWYKAQGDGWMKLMMVNAMGAPVLFEIVCEKEKIAEAIANGMAAINQELMKEVSNVQGLNVKE